MYDPPIETTPNSLFEIVSQSANNLVGNTPGNIYQLLISPKNQYPNINLEVQINFNSNKEKIWKLGFKLEQICAANDKTRKEFVFDALKKFGGTTYFYLGLHDPKIGAILNLPKYVFEYVPLPYARVELPQEMSEEEVNKFSELLEVFKLRYKRKGGGLKIKKIQWKPRFSVEAQAEAYEWALKNGLDVHIQSVKRWQFFTMCESYNQNSNKKIKFFELQDIFLAHKWRNDLSLSKIQKFLEDNFGIQFNGKIWETREHNAFVRITKDMEKKLKILKKRQSN